MLSGSAETTTTMFAMQINSLGGTFDIASSKGKGMHATIRIETQPDAAQKPHER